jgi:hypothetical protein
MRVMVAANYETRTSDVTQVQYLDFRANLETEAKTSVLVRVVAP